VKLHAISPNIWVLVFIYYS